MNKIYRLPIKELLSILNIDNTSSNSDQYNKEFPYCTKVLSTNGTYVPIHDFVMKRGEVRTYSIYDNGAAITQFSCSPDHLIISNGEIRKISDCDVIDVDGKDSKKIISSSVKYASGDLYDFALEAPHVYVTPINQYIHHNTTLAKILIKQLGIDDFDILEINASNENSVDDVREKITRFVSTMPFGSFKVILLDECDYMSPNGQAALRGVMETYADTARFILTCNYPHKVIPALHSRCQGFHIERLDKTEFTARLAEILLFEEIDLDAESLDILDTYVKATYPDLRKCINLVQMNSGTGKLLQPKGDETGSEDDYKIAAIDLFKSKQYRKARELICSQIRIDEIDDMYRWMYTNLELWGETNEEKDKAILIIRKGLVNHTLAADPEINLSATITELSQIL